MQPAGGYRTVFNGGNIPIVYECVDLWNLITRSINVFLINDRLGYNTTLAENLMPLREESGAQDNRIVANFRVPNDISIRQSGEDWQVQVIESQIDPGDMMSYIVERFQSAAPCECLSCNCSSQLSSLQCCCRHWPVLRWVSRSRHLT